jgi:hypothetical protein
MFEVSWLILRVEQRPICCKCCTQGTWNMERMETTPITDQNAASVLSRSLALHVRILTPYIQVVIRSIDQNVAYAEFTLMFKRLYRNSKRNIILTKSLLKNVNTCWLAGFRPLVYLLFLYNIPCQNHKPEYTYIHIHVQIYTYICTATAQYIFPASFPFFFRAYFLFLSFFQFSFLFLLSFFLFVFVFVYIFPSSDIFSYFPPPPVTFLH